MTTLSKKFDAMSSIAAHQLFAKLERQGEADLTSVRFIEMVFPHTSDAREIPPTLMVDITVFDDIKQGFTAALLSDLPNIPVYQQAVNVMQQIADRDKRSFDVHNFREVVASKLFELLLARHTVQEYNDIRDAADALAGKENGRFRIGFITEETE